LMLHPFACSMVDEVRERKPRMTSETRTRTGSLRYDERLHPSFPPPAIASSDSDEILKLRTDNARLQRLVAELLVENQQLRQRHCGSNSDAGFNSGSNSSSNSGFKRDAEYADTSAAHIPYRRDS
jgi:hypothetical protein